LFYYFIYCDINNILFYLAYEIHTKFTIELQYEVYIKLRINDNQIQKVETNLVKAFCHYCCI